MAMIISFYWKQIRSLAVEYEKIGKKVLEDERNTLQIHFNRDELLVGFIIIVVSSFHFK